MLRFDSGVALRLATTAALIATLVTPGVAVATDSPVTVTGLVTDAATGAPVSGAEIYVERTISVTDDASRDYPATMTVHTDAAGRYSVTGLGSGWSYWAYAEASGYAEAHAPFRYYGSTVTLDLKMQPVFATARGTLTDDGVPAMGMNVQLWSRSASGEERLVDDRSTDISGAFTVCGPAGSAGTYFLRIEDGVGLAVQSDDFRSDGVQAFVYDADLGEFTRRLASSTRYATAVSIAREQYDPEGLGTWTGVDSIVIASGENRFAADPLTAASLCGAVDAPLFLLPSSAVPDAVATAVREIVAANGTVKVYVVGGESSVPAARMRDLSEISGGRLTFERVAGTDRYTTAAAVARRVISIAGEPEAVLVANGERPASFYDALALSPVAAAQGFPVLLVKQASVPAATQAVIDSVGAPRVVVAGGTGAVGAGVLGELGAERWSGASRFDTAVAIASHAVAEGWLDPQLVGVAANLPDALAGGSFCGAGDGVLLLTDRGQLSGATRAWLEANDAQVDGCVLFGGQASVQENVRTQIVSTLARGLSEQ